MITKLLTRSWKFSQEIRRTFVSNEFQNVFDKYLITKISAVPLQNGKCIESDINLFVNKLADDEIKKRDVLQQFFKLRSTMEGTSAFNLANHLIAKRLIEAGKHENLADILFNRLYYRIFLDDYTCCYILHYLLQKNQYEAAAKIATQFIFSENCENPLVNVILIKTLYKYAESLSNITTETSTEESSSTETKKRIKYLRNTPINYAAENCLTNEFIGRALINFVDNYMAEIKINLKMLGLTLCGKFQDCVNILQSTDAKYVNKDVLATCKLLLKNKEGDAVNAIQNFQPESNESESFDEKLNKIITEKYEQLEVNLIEAQTQKYSKWVDECKYDIENQQKSRDNVLRLANIESSLKEFQTEYKKLNFFAMQDKIDLEIFQKQKVYPKRWFGKKKKPRVIDENYVPPEITKRAN